MGVGVDEYMEFLISNILERIDKCSKEGENYLQTDRQNFVLDNKKNSEQSNNSAMGRCC